MLARAWCNWNTKNGYVNPFSTTLEPTTLQPLWKTVWKFFQKVKTYICHVT